MCNSERPGVLNSEVGAHERFRLERQKEGGVEGAAVAARSLTTSVCAITEVRMM